MKPLVFFANRWMGLTVVPCVLTAAMAFGQGSPAQTRTPERPSLPSVPAARQAPSLQLQTLDSSSRPDPFPQPNPAHFTAATPSVATVDSYLRAVLGFDQNRIWRVEGVQSTSAPGVTRVTVYLADRGATVAKVQTAVLYVTPDGTHAISGNAGITPFGAQPYAEGRAMVTERAQGAWRGASSKDLELVEFADLQCARCKDAQATMKRLGEDFPKAHLVYQSYPLTQLHPLAFRAATAGSCVQKKSNDAFFIYLGAMYDAQAALTPDTLDDTLRDAVVKAGGDPAAVAACASSDAAKAEVNASIKLAEDLNVGETPSLVVNGRVLPMTLPYETLKSIIIFQAQLDGVSAAAVNPPGHGPIGGQAGGQGAAPNGK